MALSHSPKIVTDGLVFAYDMGNTQKSWKGAPATNLLINSVIPFANIYNFPNSTGTITQNYRQAPDGTNTAQQLSSAGTGLGTQFYTYVTTTTPSGTVYTFSFYTLSSSQTGWVIGGVGINQCTINSTTNVLLPNGWYRWSVVVTTTTNNAIIALMAQVSIGTNLVVWGGQIELGSFATPLIPTISTIASRSNTQAIVDLTNNNLITATNLTYASDGTFSFNGTNNEFHPTINHSYLSSSALEVVFRSASHGSGYKTIFGYSHNNGYSVPTIGSLYLNGNTLSATVITASQVYRTATSSVSIATNTFYQVVLNKNTSTGVLDIYVNGVITGTQTFDAATYGQWSSAGQYIGSNVLDIGKSTNTVSAQGWSTDFFNGVIPVAKVYNRTLSATEVQQNFNAYRGRYGI